MAVVLSVYNSFIKGIQRRFVDIVIAKGQAAYETLEDTDKEKCYFLLMAKCDTVSKALGVNPENLVILKNS